MASWSSYHWMRAPSNLMQFKFSTQTLHRRNGTGCRVYTGDVAEEGHEIRNWRLHNMEDKSRTDRKEGGAIFIEENISYGRTLNISHEIEGVSIKIRTIEQDNQHHNCLPTTSGTHWFRNYQTNTCLQKSHYMRRHGCQEHSLVSCPERQSRRTIGWSGWWTRPHSAEHRKKYRPQHRRLKHPSRCRPCQLQPLVEMLLEDHRRWWVGKWPPPNPRHLQRTTEHGGDPLINTIMLYSSDAFAGLWPMWQQRRSIFGGRTYPGLPRVEESVELWRTDGRRSSEQTTARHRVDRFPQVAWRRTIAINFDPTKRFSSDLDQSDKHDMKHATPQQQGASASGRIGEDPRHDDVFSVCEEINDSNSRFVMIEPGSLKQRNEQKASWYGIQGALFTFRSRLFWRISVRVAGIKLTSLGCWEGGKGKWVRRILWSKFGEDAFNFVLVDTKQVCYPVNDRLHA